MTRTTPPRPFDIAEVLPQLAPLARPAVRLHPRPGAPSPWEISVGGPLLWPADEPWPHCGALHAPFDPPGSVDLHSPVSVEGVRLARRARAAALGRPHADPYDPPFTAEEEAALIRAQITRPWPEDRVAMLPVAQLFLRDVPLLRPPGDADLLQVLWCPFDVHEDGPFPRNIVHWRRADEVTSVLRDPPGPAVAQYESYVPEPCVLHPEPVTEYPNAMVLDRGLLERIGQWEARQAGETVANSYEAANRALGSGGIYWSALSVAPGWKAGGWTHWGRTDPYPVTCPTCSTEMAPLLTIDSREWCPNGLTWIPYEDQGRTVPSADWLRPGNPAMTVIGDGDTLQLYACPADPAHPHTAELQ